MVREVPAKYKRTNTVVKYSMKWLGSRTRDRNVPQREAAVRYDQRRASRGTVQSGHGKQCCQEAPRDDYLEEHPGEAVSESWRRLHKSTYGGHLNNIVCNIEKLLAIWSSILCTILLLILLNITLNIMWNTVNNIEQLF